MSTTIYSKNDVRWSWVGTGVQSPHRFSSTMYVHRGAAAALVDYPHERNVVVHGLPYSPVRVQPVLVLSLRFCQGGLTRLIVSVHECISIHRRWRGWCGRYGTMKVTVKHKGSKVIQLDWLKIATWACADIFTVAV